MIAVIRAVRSLLLVVRPTAVALLVLIAGGWVGAAAAAPPAIDGRITEGEYASHYQARRIGMEVHWTIEGDSIYFGLKVPATGWLAIGWDPSPSWKVRIFSSATSGGVRPGGLMVLLEHVRAEGPIPVFVFTNGVKGEGPSGFQPDVFDAAPGNPRYTPLRRVNLVTWKDGVRARVLRSVEEIQRARARSEVTVAQPAVVVTCLS